MAKNSMDPLELLCKRGMEGDVDFLREALRGVGGGHHSLSRASTRGTPRCRRKSARSMVNVVWIALPTATAIAAEIGTPGWVRWNYASPRSGRAATSPACWNPGDAARRRCWQ